MHKIALIGAGQIGSRHLQALARVELSLEIEIVEPFKEARSLAKTRFQEVSTHSLHSLKFAESIQDLSQDLDLVIVATSSDVRAEILKILLKSKKVKFLLLEKVLFQNEFEYSEIAELLKKNNVQAWVNLPRRTFPFYRKVKESLIDAKSISYQVTGGDWGIACNGLHYMELLTYLVDSTDYTVSNHFLSQFVIPSKRAGFVEVRGKLIGHIGSHTFDFTSFDHISPVLLTISSDKAVWLINESAGWYRTASAESNWKWREENEKIVLFQSELTHLTVLNLLQTGKCDLPDYQMACAIHLPFIRCLKSHIEKVTNQILSHCPIT